MATSIMRAEAINRRVIIEARNPKNGDWNSDYVGNESLSLIEAEHIVDNLRHRAANDPVEDGTVEDGTYDTEDGVSWNGWLFRIMAEIDGHYGYEVI